MLGRENTSMAPGESRHAEATGERGFPYYLTRVHVGMSGFPHAKNICLSFTSQIPASDCGHGFVHRDKAWAGCDGTFGSLCSIFQFPALLWST